MAALYPLPQPFSREEAALRQGGIEGWNQLAALNDAQLRQLAGV
mgnify:FL=1